MKLIHRIAHDTRLLHFIIAQLETGRVFIIRQNQNVVETNQSPLNAPLTCLLIALKARSKHLRTKMLRKRHITRSIFRLPRNLN